MDDKTEQLRDIFVEVADDETVTESQEESRGSLTQDRSVDERLRGVIEQLRDRFAFETDWSVPEYQQLVRQFYDGQDDATIADDRPVEAVFSARMDLHLVHDDDPPGIDESTLATIRERQGDDVESIETALGLDGTAVERALAVIETRNRARRVSHRFTTAFEEILTDADLSIQFAADAHEDGLEDATEGAEVDVDF